MATPYKINLDQLKLSTLVIKEDVNGNLYANIVAKNNKIIFKTSESYSYKNKHGFINALNYISKPAVIKIDLPTKHWKYVRKLEIMLDKLWTQEKRN